MGLSATCASAHNQACAVWARRDCFGSSGCSDLAMPMPREGQWLLAPAQGAKRSPGPGAARSRPSNPRSMSSTTARTAIPITHDRIPTREQPDASAQCVALSKLAPAHQSAGSSPGEQRHPWRLGHKAVVRLRAGCAVELRARAASSTRGLLVCRQGPASPQAGPRSTRRMAECRCHVRRSTYRPRITGCDQSGVEEVVVRDGGSLFPDGVDRLRGGGVRRMVRDPKSVLERP